MTAQHTPGPWEFEQQPGSEWWFGDGKQIVIRQVGGKKWDSFAVMAAEENGLANARLIAAAPGLLYALKALLSASVGEFNDEHMGVAIDLAHAAIADATGEQA